MVYYKVDSKLDDLSDFNGVTGDIVMEINCPDMDNQTSFDEYVNYSNEIREKFVDGYYVAVAVYKQNPNINDVGVTKSQLHVKNDDENSNFTLYIDTNFDDGNGNIISVFRNYDNPDNIYTKQNEKNETEYIKNAADLIFIDRSELNIEIQRIFAYDLTSTNIFGILESLIEFYENDEIEGRKRINEAGNYIVLTRYIDNEGFKSDNFIAMFTVKNYEP